MEGEEVSPALEPGGETTPGREMEGEVEEATIFAEEPRGEDNPRRGMEGEMASPSQEPGREARGLEDEVASTRPTLDMIFSDWMDFSHAIDCIPGGASCGPDGLPAIVLKKAKVPPARMI